MFPNPNISRNRVEQESTGKGTAIRATLDHLTYLGKLQETKVGGTRRYLVLEELDALPVFDGGVDD